MTHTHDIAIAEQHIGHVSAQFPRAHDLERLGLGHLAKKRCEFVMRQVRDIRIEQRTPRLFAEIAALKCGDLVESTGVAEKIAELLAASITSLETLKDQRLEWR